MTSSQSIIINGVPIGGSHSCYFIAEIAGNFATEAEAARIVDAAVRAGAHAVKFQTFDADTITTRSNRFNMASVGNQLQYEVFRQAQTPFALQQFVANYCKARGITVFSAPSHLQDIDAMLKLDLPAWKIGSDLATHIPLLREVAATGKPIFLSTGMCTLAEVERSVSAVLKAGNPNLLLFHCVANYPGLPEEQNLSAMSTLRRLFGLPVGFSDHVPGIAVSLAAVALGAEMIERHFWCHGNQEGADRNISSDESEFRRLTTGTAEIRLALGSGRKEPALSERENRRTNRVSIILMQAAEAGSEIRPEMIDIRRPGSGLPPHEWPNLLGRRLKKRLPAEAPLTWDCVQW
jgi:N-acetylneuraminate synthase